MSATKSDVTTTEPSVEDCVTEIRQLFPDATFISVKNHAIYQLSSMIHRPQADIQIEDRGCRRESLSECMAIVRGWHREPIEVPGSQQGE